jgi:tripartite-type tricarboxylate transporter receptor subunit TctC
MKIQSCITLLVALFAALGISSSVLGQAYPDRPIRFVVPYPPGGTTDIVARLAQNALSNVIGQQIVIDNRGGATGAIGAEFVAKSKPDGYTIMYTPCTDMVLRQFVMKGNPVDTIRDFTPIISPVKTSTIIVAHPSMPFSNVKEFLEYAKLNPGKLTFGTSGFGSNHHLGGELLKMHGIVLTHVPYKGGGPALAAVIAGETSLEIGDLTGLLPAVRDGRVKALALIDPIRHKDFPNLPVMGETLPGYSMPESLFGVFGPAGLPRPIVTRLNADIAKAFNNPEVRAKIEDRGIPVITGTPEDLAVNLKKSLEIYGSIVKAAGIQPE